MLIVATDMDRTLLPNGVQEYDNSMGLFTKIVKEEKIVLIYVTGRRVGEVYDAVRKYKVPVPDYVVASVGTKIYLNKEGKLVEDDRWIEHVGRSTANWDVESFKDALKSVEGLHMQPEECQNKFKLSYHIDAKNHEEVVKEVNGLIEAVCKDATIIYSMNEANGEKYLDIVPEAATKVTGLEYLREKLRAKKEEVVYCGDSGNDVLPLTFGYRAILVRNAIGEVKDIVRELCIKNDCLEELYIAQGTGKLNGYYVSGIIEGLVEFGVVDKKYLPK